MPWQSKVPNVEVETHKVAAPDVVIPTVDTVRHEVLLYTWLAEHKAAGAVRATRKWENNDSFLFITIFT